MVRVSIPSAGMGQRGEIPKRRATTSDHLPSTPVIFPLFPKTDLPDLLVLFFLFLCPVLGLPMSPTGSAQSSHGSERAEEAADIWTKSWAMAGEGCRARREGGHLEAAQQRPEGLLRADDGRWGPHR